LVKSAYKQVLALTRGVQGAANIGKGGSDSAMFPLKETEIHVCIHDKMLPFEKTDRNPMHGNNSVYRLENLAKLEAKKVNG
jgi:hypothetical protein